VAADWELTRRVPVISEKQVLLLSGERICSGFIQAFSVRFSSKSCEIFMEAVMPVSSSRPRFLAYALLILAAIVPVWGAPFESPYAARRAAVIAKIAGGMAIIPSQAASPRGPQDSKEFYYLTGTAQPEGNSDDTQDTSGGPQFSNFNKPIRVKARTLDTNIFFMLGVHVFVLHEGCGTLQYLNFQFFLLGR
jgi:hypothetical protein